MAKTKQSAKEFIQSTFPPMVAVMSSPSANEICLKNKMTFAELLQPFSKVQMEIHVREPSGTVAVMKELKLSISEWTTRPPQSMLARKYLNESVSQITNYPTKSMKIGNRTIDVPIATPWFEEWRETFLRVQFPLDHEFTRHYLACFVGVSSAEDNLTGTLAFMNQELSQSISAHANMANLPKWFGLSICKYYVMIHDTSCVDANVAKASFDTLKTFHGDSNCYLLSINSQSPDPTRTPGVDLWAPLITRRSSNLEEVDTSEQKAPKAELSQDSSTILHPLSPEADQSLSMSSSLGDKDQLTDPSTAVRFGELLSSDDVIRIKQLMKDFVNKALVPYVESQIHSLTEIIANKKGVSRTLFSATKRWFGTSKPGSQSPGAAPPPTSVIYCQDSQELQLRRLGDLCFMFGLYSLAFQAFHSAKRDFGADSAWLYYAGSLEMASLSAFLANIETRKAMEYLEESIGCYLNHCKMPQFATRATLLSFEFLKDIGSYSEAARQLVRMTSEDSDLRSGLLLEQAAYCHLYAARSRNMGRKYAFHLVLAGHRYAKAKQRRHSLRCFRQANQVYENSGWTAAMDHIHLTIGKHTAALQQLEESVHFMSMLLGPSKQLPAQQESYLRDYILTLQQLNKSSPHIDIALPLPQVNRQSIQLLLGTPIDPEKSLGTPASGVSFHESKASVAKWRRLEEQILSHVHSNVAFVFKPLVSLYSCDTAASSSSFPVAVVGEKVCVNIELCNPMNIAIHLKELSLEAKSSGLCVEPLAHTSLTLAPDSRTEVTLSLVPKSPGEVHIEGIRYDLCSSNREDLVCIPGIQKFAPCTTPLTVHVIETAPCLQVYFRKAQGQVLAQELQELRLVLRSLGAAPIRRLLLATPTPALLALPSSSHTPSPTVTEVPLPTSLAPGASYILPLWVQAPPDPGPAQLDLLFYYDTDPPPTPTPAKSKLRYRLLRHTFHLNVLQSLHCNVVASRSCASSQTIPTVNLRLQVKNTSCSQENETVSSVIELDHISLSSSNWKLKPLIEPHERIRLDKQEVSHSLLQAESCATSSISDLDLSGSAGGPSLSQAPFHNFLLKSNISKPENGEEDEEDDSRLTAGAIFFKGKLVVRWKATVSDIKSGQSRDALGQHIIPLDALDTATCFPSTPAALHPLPASPIKFFGARHGRSSETKTGESIVHKKQLAAYFLKYVAHVEHDFVNNKIAIVPVEARIENHSSTKLELKFKTNIDKPSVLRSQLITPHCLHTFRYVGVCLSGLTLDPGASQRIFISAAFTRPGTYDLQSRIMLSAAVASDGWDTTFVPQDSGTNSLLIIGDLGKTEGGGIVSGGS